MPVERAFEGAIFDLDGTLLDSMHVWERVDLTFLRKRGLEVPADYSRAISAMSFRRTAEYTIERFALPETADGLMREWRELALYEYAHNVKLKPGASGYLRRLKESGVRLATATSLFEELSAAVLRNTGVYELFDAFCNTSEVTRGKEFPDVFILAAEKLGLPPERCIVFEDILPAVLAAKSAGMTVCCVGDSASDHNRLELTKSAHYCIDDFSKAPLLRSQPFE